MDDYLERIVDSELHYLLSGLPAVAVQGPKGVGKTETASRLAASTIRLDSPPQLQALQADRTQISDLAHPLLLDEWQLDPPIWDQVRRQVDGNASPGQFILTGSANPAHTRIHSGAGRIVNLRMRPLSFAERQLQDATVSLRAILEGQSPNITGHTPLTLRDYVREILASGFPSIRRYPEEFQRRQLSSYIDHAIDHEVPALGTPLRRPASMRAWMQAYARAVSTTESYEKISDRVSPQARPTRPTIMDYRDALTSLWLLDPVPAWVAQTSSLRGIGQAPKHQLADPALAARLLGLTPKLLLPGLLSPSEQVDSGPKEPAAMLGPLFEALVTLSVRTYAQPLDLDVSHLRTHRGEREIDLILSTEGGDIIAIEVKLAEAIHDHDVRHLNWLKQQLGDRIKDRLIITTGPQAYRRPDGVAVVPLALLGV